MLGQSPNTSGSFASQGALAEKEYAFLAMLVFERVFVIIG
jgi:hypothetical protein